MLNENEYKYCDISVFKLVKNIEESNLVPKKGLINYKIHHPLANHFINNKFNTCA